MRKADVMTDDTNERPTAKVDFGSSRAGGGAAGKGVYCPLWGPPWETPYCHRADSSLYLLYILIIIHDHHISTWLYEITIPSCIILSPLTAATQASTCKTKEETSRLLPLHYRNMRLFAATPLTTNREYQHHLLLLAHSHLPSSSADLPIQTSWNPHPVQRN